MTTAIQSYVKKINLKIFLVNVQDRNQTPFRIRNKLPKSLCKMSSLSISKNENGTVKNINLNQHNCIDYENDLKHFENEKKNFSNLNMLNNELLKLGIIFKNSANRILLANSYLFFTIVFIIFLILSKIYFRANDDRSKNYNKKFRLQAFSIKKPEEHEKS